MSLYLLIPLSDIYAVYAWSETCCVTVSETDEGHNIKGPPSDTWDAGVLEEVWEGREGPQKEGGEGGPGEEEDGPGAEWGKAVRGPFIQYMQPWTQNMLFSPPAGGVINNVFYKEILQFCLLHKMNFDRKISASEKFYNHSLYIQNTDIYFITHWNSF